jgi:Holliday junction resolvase RusA-like endonuclease
LTEVLKPFETKQIIEGDWNELDVKFYFGYPKSTPKKKRRVLEYMRYKCDCDNLVKPVMDVMEKLGWIRDDRQISKLSVVKLQGELEPYIEISLYE